MTTKIHKKHKHTNHNHNENHIHVVIHNEKKKSKKHRKTHHKVKTLQGQQQQGLNYINPVYDNQAHTFFTGNGGGGGFYPVHGGSIDYNNVNKKEHSMKSQSQNLLSDANNDDIYNSLFNDYLKKKLAEKTPPPVPQIKDDISQKAQDDANLLTGYPQARLRDAKYDALLPENAITPVDTTVLKPKTPKAKITELTDETQNAIKNPSKYNAFLEMAYPDIPDEERKKITTRKGVRDHQEEHKLKSMKNNPALFDHSSITTHIEPLEEHVKTHSPPLDITPYPSFNDKTVEAPEHDLKTFQRQNHTDAHDETSTRLSLSSEDVPEIIDHRLFRNDESPNAPTRHWKYQPNYKRSDTIDEEEDEDITSFKTPPSDPKRVSIPLQGQTPKKSVQKQRLSRNGSQSADDRQIKEVNVPSTLSSPQELHEKVNIKEIHLDSVKGFPKEDALNENGLVGFQAGREKHESETPKKEATVLEYIDNKLSPAVFLREEKPRSGTPSRVAQDLREKTDSARGAEKTPLTPMTPLFKYSSKLPMSARAQNYDATLDNARIMRDVKKAETKEAKEAKEANIKILNEANITLRKKPATAREKLNFF